MSTYETLKQWRATHRAEQQRINWRADIKRIYGLAESDYEEMLKAQNGVCKICGNECARGRLSVDHDHHTGRVRGLLCRDCNVNNGIFNDDPNLLRRAAEYLEGQNNGFTATTPVSK